jgi:hypothetical protein
MRGWQEQYLTLVVRYSTVPTQYTTRKTVTLSPPVHRESKHGKCELFLPTKWTCLLPYTDGTIEAGRGGLCPISHGASDVCALFRSFESPFVDLSILFYFVLFYFSHFPTVNKPKMVFILLLS